MNRETFHNNNMEKKGLIFHIKVSIKQKNGIHIK